VLFHHDPGHDDARLDMLGADAMAGWARVGGEGPVEIAREGRVIELAP
jgi:hypothetical protein